MCLLSFCPPLILGRGAARIGRDCLRFVRSYVSDVLFLWLHLQSFCPPLNRGRKAARIGS